MLMTCISQYKPYTTSTPSERQKVQSIYIQYTHKKIQKLYKNLIQKNRHQKPKMIEQYTKLRCPVCNHVFPHNTDIQKFMSHTKQCRKKMQEKKQENQKQEFVYQKIAVDETNTKYKWQKKPKQQPDNSIPKLPVQQIKKLSFQKKQQWFRHRLESLRIPWTSGSDKIRIHKQGLLMHSISQLPTINMHKQVKIQFIQQKVNDAGGLLRQWIHMIIKQIFNFDSGIFVFANNQGQTMYSLKWDQELDQDFSGRVLDLLGVVIGKALFERIPVNCFMDRTILRQLCGGEVGIQDIYGYDSQLYKNWKYILDTPDIQSQQLDTYFTTYKNTGQQIIQFQLLQGHKDIKLDNQNKQLYISLCIQFHTKIHKQKSIKYIKSGIGKVFSPQFLQIFQPHQLEMLLYGVPFIDIQDWHDNTQYKEPYNQGHQVVRWFWEVMNEFGQEELGRVLHFCTASSRTPIQGFGKLESNRGNYAKFKIVPVEFTKKNPYPKAHTCFNRLELPLYPQFKLMKEYLTAISHNQLQGVFGLD